MSIIKKKKTLGSRPYIVAPPPVKKIIYHIGDTFTFGYRVTKELNSHPSKSAPLFLLSKMVSQSQLMDHYSDLSYLSRA